MKQKLLIIFVLFLSQLSFAQKNTFFPIEKGTILKYGNYEKNMKPTKDMSWTSIEVYSVNTVNEVITVDTKLDWDGKDKMPADEATEIEKYISGTKIRISRDSVYFNMFSSVVDNLILELEQLGKETEKYEASFKVYTEAMPRNLAVGTTLPSGRMALQVHKHKKNKDKEIIHFLCDIKNRKVESKESVTTPAGTFECYKVTEDYYLDVKAYFMKARETVKSVTWYNPEVGSVKSEMYDKKGKVTETTVLESISNK